MVFEKGKQPGRFSGIFPSENCFVIIENSFRVHYKENPKEDTNKKYTVWKVLSYSEEDPCTSAILYIDANTGKIIGGKINYATD